MRFDYFRPYEFRCRCGCGGGYADMDAPFLERLTIARWHAGVPFVLNSAFRCPAWNAHPDVRGEPDSAHLSGHAVDISATYGKLRFRVVSGLLAAGFTRMGIYPWGIHVDDDPTKPEGTIWTGK